MKTLALDPGTTTGWAFCDCLQIGGGTWDFTPKRGDGAGIRFLRLQWKLDDFFENYGIDRLVYELPAGHYKSGAADDCIKGLVAHIQSWCEKNNVPCEAKAPKEIKKWATGNGNAKKEMMLAAAQKLWPSVTDHNHADAMLLLAMATESHN